MTARSREAPVKLLYQFLSSPRPRPHGLRPTICLQCRSRFPNLSPGASRDLMHSRTTDGGGRRFSTSALLGKKSSASAKAGRKSHEGTAAKNKHEQVPDNAATKDRDGEMDPYDFTELKEGMARAVERLRDALVKTRDAGRITADMVEALPVEVNVKGKETHGGRAHHERTTLGQLASVVQKGGRMLQVYCAEEALVKPINSAIQASPHSLVPQADPTNPLLVNVPVPPATAETRAQARVEAKKVFERASTDVRNARGDAQKRHRKMEQGKLVVVDELRKAHKQMEDVVRKGQDECKKVYEAALKGLEG